jgi:hypothetical protein
VDTFCNMKGRLAAIPWATKRPARGPAFSQVLMS